MKKTDFTKVLVAELEARKISIGGGKAMQIIAATIDTVQKTLATTKENEVVLMRGLKAKKITRKARQGRNPKTGEAVQIKEKSVIQFRGAKLKLGIG